MVKLFRKGGSMNELINIKNQQAVMDVIGKVNS